MLQDFSDFTFMEVENAQLFVNSPNAITENRKEICDNASAKFQSEEAGNVEFRRNKKTEVIEGIQKLSFCITIK